jgi:hypothetical protein
VHGDLHPWNVAYGPAATRVFDWTDAAVSHAFVDLATYVFRTNDQAVRRRLIDAHVSAWSTVGSEQSLREAVGLGLVVGALYQVQSYRALLPTLMGNGADDGLAGADLSLDQALPDVSRARSREPGLTTHRLARVERRTPTATEDLHRIPPSAQRVLRRGLHPQPDAHSQPTLGAHKAPAPDLQDQVRECRLTRSLKSAHWEIPARKPSDPLRTSPWPLHRSTDARALDGFRLLAAQGGCTGSRCGSGIGRIRRDRRWRPVLA